MQWLLAAYTAGFQHRHRRVGHGHLFQGRYQSVLVEAEGYLLPLSRYIHLNPVRGEVLGRGELAERRRRLRAWRWSSFAGYAGLRAAHPFVTEDLVAGELARFAPGCGPGQRRLAYRRYVEVGLVERQASPLERAAAGAVLGSESFVQGVRDRLAVAGDAQPSPRQREQRGEVTALRGLVGREPAAAGRAERIIALVAAHYGVSAERVTAAGPGRGLEARGAALVLVREGTGWTHREIGERFGGVHYAAVAQRIGRAVQRECAGGTLQGSMRTLRAQCQTI